MSNEPMMETFDDFNDLLRKLERGETTRVAVRELVARLVLHTSPRVAHQAQQILGGR